MDRQREICRVTLAGSLVNLLLVVYKLAAGILGNSSAMLADAAHSLSDFATDLVVLVFVRISGKPGDADHDYGHGKFETLATVIIGLALVGVGLGMLLESGRLISGFYHVERLEQPNWLALSAAIISIILKEWLYRYTIRASHRLDSAALAANAWHHRSDSLTSIAALIGIGGAMLLGPAWRVLDPLAAAVVSCLIIKMSLPLLRRGLGELLEKSLPQTEKAIIGRIIASTPGVITFHNLRTRRIGSRRAVEAHIQMAGGISLKEAHDIASNVERRLRAELGKDTYVSLHMEPAEEGSANE